MLKDRTKGKKFQENISFFFKFYSQSKPRKMTNTEHQTEKEKTVPNGKYTYIGIDIDTTGRRILDEVRIFSKFFFSSLSSSTKTNIFWNYFSLFDSEKKKIVHIAAYSPTEQFDQYVIPVMNLNPAARQRHHLRVITVGFFRMLKCTATNKVLKCKTEVVALKSFLDWLEERKMADTDSNGVILVSHEPIKFIPFMLLEAFKKYDLLERFTSLVTGFVDGHTLTEENGDIDDGGAHDDTVKQITLRDLAKMYLPDESEDDLRNFEGNAMVRARWAYKVIRHLAKSKCKNQKKNFFSKPKISLSNRKFIDICLVDDDDDAEITTDLIKGHVHSVNGDIIELTDQNKCIDLQHSFRPIFVQYFKTNLYHRYKAVTFRRVLAENGYDLKSLETVWTEKKKVKFLFFWITV